MLIENKLATLKEIQTEYSYSDVLDMYEVLEVKYYNEYIIQEEQERKSKKS